MNSLVGVFSWHLQKRQVSSNFANLLTSIQENRNLFQGVPGFPKNIANDLSQVSGFDSKWTFKTTGAGGFDALLFVGSLDSLQDAFQVGVRHGYFHKPKCFGTNSLTISA